MKENRTRHGADEQELEAITREIHAQLRALYAETDPVGRDERADAAECPRVAADFMRFVLALLLPPIAMVAVWLVLSLVREGL